MNIIEDVPCGGPVYLILSTHLGKGFCLLFGIRSVPEKRDQLNFTIALQNLPDTLQCLPDILIDELICVKAISYDFDSSPLKPPSDLGKFSCGIDSGNRNEEIISFLVFCQCSCNIALQGAFSENDHGAVSKGLPKREVCPCYRSRHSIFESF